MSRQQLPPIVPFACRECGRLLTRAATIKRGRCKQCEQLDRAVQIWQR